MENAFSKSDCAGYSYVKELCVANKYEKLDLNVLLLDFRMSICYVPRQVIFVSVMLLCCVKLI